MRFSSILGLFLFGCAVASVACNDEPPKDLERSSDRSEKPSAEEEEDPPARVSSPSKTETSPTTPPPTQTKPTTPAPAPNNSTACNAKAKRMECVKCCGVQQNPLKGCACNGECAGACGDNLCSDKMPSFGCGICLATNGGEQCKLDFNQDDATAAAQCVQQCAGLPE